METGMHGPLLIALLLFLALVATLVTFLRFLGHVMFPVPAAAPVPATPMSWRVANVTSAARLLFITVLALTVPVWFLSAAVALVIDAGLAFAVSPLWWRATWHGVAAWQATPVQQVRISDGIARAALRVFVFAFVLAAGLWLLGALQFWAVGAERPALSVACFSALWLFYAVWLLLCARHDGAEVALRRVVGPSAQVREA